MKKKHRRNLLLGNLVCLVVVVLFVALAQKSIDIFELKTIDERMKFKTMVGQSIDLADDFVFVNIDNYTKEKAGQTLLPKTFYSRLLNRIAENDPEIIMLDLIWGNTADTLGNQAMIDAVMNSANVVLPYLADLDSDEPSVNSDYFFDLYSFEINPDVDEPALKKIDSILFSSLTGIVEYSLAAGFSNIQPDIDGVMRRIPLIAEFNGKLAPSFALQGLCSYLDYPLENIEIPDRRHVVLKSFPTESGTSDFALKLDPDGNLIIDFTSSVFKMEDLASFSAWDILNEDIDFSILKGKMVVVSDISSDKKDFFPIPNGDLLYNSFTVAQAMNTLLHRSNISEAGYLLELLIILILSAFIVFIGIRFGKGIYHIASILMILVYIASTFIMYAYGDVILPVFSTVLPLGTVYLFTAIYIYMKTEEERIHLYSNLEGYLSPKLMKRILNDPDAMKPGGHQKDITVMFSDIVSFTDFCDNSSPEKVQDVLGEYLKVAVELVKKHDGIVDKFLGDGILAFFEDEEKKTPNQQRAVDFAIAFQKKLQKVNERIKKRLKYDLRIRIGVATGSAKVGNIGTPDKMEYTIIGSVVNLASRLEGVGGPGDITIDAETRDVLSEEYNVDEGKLIDVKGFSKPIMTYSVRYEKTYNEVQQ